MPVYLIDENMPYYFRLWNTPEYIHQLDIAPQAKDKTIWNYAKESGLTIVTKDTLQITPNDVTLPSLRCALMSLTYTESMLRIVLAVSATALCTASSTLFPGRIVFTSRFRT